MMKACMDIDQLSDQRLNKHTSQRTKSLGGNNKW